MTSRTELVDFLDELLAPDVSLDDASNNGLQVAGTDTVRRIVFGVDACLALFEAAANADFVVVHHGLSWGGGIERATGVTGDRLRSLFVHGVSLYASHLPLDRHPDVGHNAVIARELGIRDKVPFFPYHGTTIGWSGDLPEARSVANIAEALGTVLGANARGIGDTERPVRRLGIVSGGGADAVEICRKEGVECLITGEFTHRHHHLAAETDTPVIVGGHYATETPGLREVMARVEKAFDVDCQFIDLPTGL